MAFFKTDEEKQEIRNQKQAKVEERSKRFLKARGIDDLSPEFLEQVARVISRNAGNSWFEVASAFQGTAIEKIIQGMLEVQTEQNWIMIKQLDEIYKLLKEQKD